MDINEFRENNFSLVLSGGSALGYAHVGVLQELKKLKIEPSEIIGTSMGAIIGTLYSIGMNSSEIISFIENSSIFKLTSISFKKASLIDSKKIRTLFEEVLGLKTFKDLDKNLSLIATEMNSGNSSCFSKKHTPDVTILDALMASIALPVIFEPVEINSKYYVDGYLSSNFGIEFASFDYILGVDVISSSRVGDFKPKKGLFAKSRTLFKIYDRAFFLLMRNQTQFKLQQLLDKNYVVLEPNLSNYKAFNFLDYKEIISEGKKEFLKIFNL